MNNSILTTIKKLLGIPEEYSNFDTDIIIYINTVLSVLNQLGVGPEKGYKIEGSGNVWSEFISDDDPRFENIKTYIYVRVKMLFDPPLNSSVQTAFQSIQQELEFRITVAADTKSAEEVDNNE